MKKFTTALFLVTLTASLTLFVGCSSTQKSDEVVGASDLPAEATASNDAYNSLMTEDLGAVKDEGAPTYLADASGAQGAVSEPSSLSDASPVNLGASSAGRSR